MKAIFGTGVGLGGIGLIVLGIALALIVRHNKRRRSELVSGGLMSSLGFKNRRGIGRYRRSDTTTGLGRMYLLIGLFLMIIICIYTQIDLKTMSEFHFLPTFFHLQSKYLSDVFIPWGSRSLRPLRKIDDSADGMVIMMIKLSVGLSCYLRVIFFSLSGMDSDESEETLFDASTDTTTGGAGGGQYGLLTDCAILKYLKKV